MTEKIISIPDAKAIWTSPDGKVKQITTPEQVIFRSYKLPLHQHMAVENSPLTVDAEPRTPEGKKPFEEILNIKINNEWVLKDEKPQEKAQKTTGAQSSPKENMPKNRSLALSYAKDLAVADKITPDKILSYAEVFLRWLDGDIKVEDEEVFKALLKKTFNIAP